jgi:hypothetical protein
VGCSLSDKRCGATLVLIVSHGLDEGVAMVRALPANMSAETARAVYVGSDAELRSCSVAELASVEVERCAPVREFFAWPGQRSFQGWWWSRTTGTLLAFESLLERQALMAWDFEPRVVGLAVQPFALLWPRGSEAGQHHIPDLFVRLEGGGGGVVDVRPAELVDARAARQFEQTRRFCAELGWAYQVFSGLSATVRSNLEFLAGYRQDRFTLGSSFLAAALSVFAGGRELRDGAGELSRCCASPLAPVLAGCYHLLWDHELHADLGVALRASTPVWR